MRVRIVKETTIKIFIRQYPDSDTGFTDWVDKIRDANWVIPIDILNSFNTASLLGKGTSRVVFNIAGNHYRVICKYSFEGRRVKLYIKWMGTHADYTKLCSKGLQYSVNDY